MKVKIGQSEHVKGFVSDQNLFMKDLERIKRFNAFFSTHNVRCLSVKTV